jgi:hypothetical protein
VVGYNSGNTQSYDFEIIPYRSYSRNNIAVAYFWIRGGAQYGIATSAKTLNADMEIGSDGYMERVVKTRIKGELYSSYPYVCVGSYRDTGQNHFLGRLYYVRFDTISGTPLYELVPCYRKSDGVIGLYDVVNDVFRTNDGSGSFTAGADVN